MSWTIIGLALLAAVLLVLVLIALGMRALGTGGGKGEDFDEEYEEYGSAEGTEEDADDSGETEEEHAPRARSAARRSRPAEPARQGRRLLSRDRDDEGEWENDSDEMSDDDFWSSISREEERPSRKRGRSRSERGTREPEPATMAMSGFEDTEAPEEPSGPPVHDSEMTTVVFPPSGSQDTRHREEAREEGPAPAEAAAGGDTGTDPMAALASLGSSGQERGTRPEASAAPALPAAEPPSGVAGPPFTASAAPESSAAPPPAGNTGGTEFTFPRGPADSGSSFPGGGAEPFSREKGTDFASGRTRGPGDPASGASVGYEPGRQERPLRGEPAEAAPSTVPSYESRADNRPVSDSGNRWFPGGNDPAGRSAPGQNRSAPDPLTDPSFTPAGHSDSPIWSSMDTGAHQRPAMTTGPHQRPPAGPGGTPPPPTGGEPPRAPHPPHYETGAQTPPSYDTGAHQRPAMTTGPHQRPPAGPYPATGGYPPPGGAETPPAGTSAPGVPAGAEGGGYSAHTTGEYPSMRGVAPPDPWSTGYRSHPEGPAGGQEAGGFPSPPPPNEATWGGPPSWADSPAPKQTGANPSYGYGPGPSSGPPPGFGEPYGEFPDGTATEPVRPSAPMPGEYGAESYYPPAPTGGYPAMGGAPPTGPYPSGSDVLGPPPGGGEPGPYPGPPPPPAPQQNYGAPPDWHPARPAEGGWLSEENGEYERRGPYQYDDGMYR